MPSSHLILCSHLLLPPSIFPSIRVFSKSVLHIRWPNYWSFSFNISPANEHSGLIAFRMDWLDLPAVQGTLKSLLQHHTSKASFFGAQQEEKRKETRHRLPWPPSGSSEQSKGPFWSRTFWSRSFAKQPLKARSAWEMCRCPQWAPLYPGQYRGPVPAQALNGTGSADPAQRVFSSGPRWPLRSLADSWRLALGLDFAKRSPKQTISLPQRPPIRTTTARSRFDI